MSVAPSCKFPKTTYQSKDQTLLAKKSGLRQFFGLCSGIALASAVKVISVVAKKGFSSPSVALPLALTVAGGALAYRSYSRLNKVDNELSLISYNQAKELDSVQAFNYLSTLKDKNGVINLDKMREVPGGGTHDIYKKGENPKFLLKVMRKTKGRPSLILEGQLKELNDKYDQVYRVFGRGNCIVESRYIARVKGNDGIPKEAIISIVKHETCFDSQEKFGFNVGEIEAGEIHIKKHPEQYTRMNMSLMGKEPVDLDDFILFEGSFRSIFDKIDQDKSFKEAMTNFLTHFKIHYEKTGLFMDFKGRDNVLFYKTESGWNYKVGSVLKGETTSRTREMLKEIRTNPSAATISFENSTSIFYVPSWIRALNATGEKLGIGKVVTDITLTKDDSANLAKIHEQLPQSRRAFDRAWYHAKNGQFEKSLEFFQQKEPIKPSHLTKASDLLGTTFWTSLDKNEITPSSDQIQTFLRLLVNPRNEYPRQRWSKVNKAIIGLLSKLESQEKLDPAIKQASEKMLDRLSSK